jgi:hypothetical protein
VFGADVKLGALLASAVSTCAAISAAGAVQAKREQLAYAASLVIVVAPPSIFILPRPILRRLGLQPTVHPFLAFHNTVQEVEVLVDAVRRIVAYPGATHCYKGVQLSVGGSSGAQVGTAHSPGRGRTLR